MTFPVLVLGEGGVAIAGDALREGDGPDSSPEALLARRPRAVIVASAGEPGFFRASLAMEHGCARVVLRRGAFPRGWLDELAFRAETFSAELFEHDDENGYTRVRAATGAVRASVGGPPHRWHDDVEPVTPTRRPEAEAGGRRHWYRSGRVPQRHDDVESPAPDAVVPGFMIDDGWQEWMAAAEPLAVDSDVSGLPVNLEETAFTIGDKPVLYLVLPRAEVDACVARHPGASAVARDGVIGVDGSTGARSYGGDGEPSVHLFLSAGRAAAEEAARLWEAGSSRHLVKLGELLGYPRCCTAAFAALGDRRNNAALVYVTAARTRALGAAFAPPLNVVVSRVVPFTPCTFACREATRLAERVLAALPAEQGAQLARSISRPVLYLDEERAVVFDGAILREDVIEYERAAFLGRRGLDSAVVTNTRRLLSALLPPHGRVRITETGLEGGREGAPRVFPRARVSLGSLLPFRV